MKLKTVQNCINCGAKLEPLTHERVKCAYCGTVYEKPEKDQNVTEAESSVPQNTANSTQQESGNSGCGILFLIAIVIVVIAIYVNKERDGKSIEIVDSVVIDTADIYPSTEGLYTYNNEKKIYTKKKSEKGVSVSGKIYHQAYASVLSVTFKHDAPVDARIDRIKFQFKLFDKAGKELKTGDSNERDVSTWLYKGHANTEEWWLAKRLPEAKSVKFYVKEIEFENEIWKYE